MKNEEKPPVDITRREALKRIGKLGLYVPPTLAVLTAAPRAFAQSATATLTGTVEDSSTNQPIEGATVRVHCNPGLETTTNALGQYTIPNIPPGTWETEWMKSGYIAKSEFILYQAGQVVVRNQCLV